MKESICGLDCTKCSMKDNCCGCEAIGEKCVIAACCKSKGKERCKGFFKPESKCSLRNDLIEEFNALGIENMEKITELNALSGAFINLEYKLPCGQNVRFWDDGRVYLGNQVSKMNSDRCYGLAADENYLMVSEYGKDGSDCEIVVFKRRKF